MLSYTPLANNEPSDHKALIVYLYNAFKQKDYATMAKCYHSDAYFRDEAFELSGKDMTLEFSVSEQAGNITAHWEPKYSFSQTGRFVHNIVDAEFEFKDGLIIKHIDRFNFWNWSRQALGAPGLLLGWTPLLRNKVAKMAMTNLVKFMEI